MHGSKFVNGTVFNPVKATFLRIFDPLTREGDDLPIQKIMDWTQSNPLNVNSF